MAPDILPERRGEIMTRDPRTIGPRALAVEGVADDERAAAPGDRAVRDRGDRPVGALHLHDCLKAGIA